MTGASAYDRLIDALAYAQAGWPVLPVALEVKAPLTRHGFYDASTDPEIVARWWNEWPRARIGLCRSPTRSPSCNPLPMEVKR